MTWTTSGLRSRGPSGKCAQSLPRHGCQERGLTHDSEALYEDESFPNRELAALVAAKVYYQLQEYNESMVFALGAGKLFRLDHQGEFEETIVGM